MTGWIAAVLTLACVLLGGASTWAQPPVNRPGGISLSPTDDSVPLGNGTRWENKVFPDCSNGTTSKLLYSASTNSFSCGTDQSGAGSFDGNVTGAFNLSGDTSPAQWTSDQNNYDPGANSVVRFTTDASRNLTGMDPAATDDGQVVALCNVGAFNAVVKDQDTGSSAANRFELVADVTITPNTCVAFWYDTTTDRWRQLTGTVSSVGVSVAGAQRLSVANTPVRDSGTVTLGTKPCNNIGDVGATVTIDLNNGPCHELTLDSANLLLTINNQNSGELYDVLITQDNATPRTVTVTASVGSVVWPGLSTPPAVNSALNSVTQLSCSQGTSNLYCFMNHSGGEGRALVNAQTGTTYTVLTGDRGKLVTHTNGSAIAVTLPQAGTSFPAGWYYDAQNRGAGTVTITPTTSTIDGAASLALTTSQGVRIFSDGANYFTQRGMGSGGGAAASTAYSHLNAVTGGTWGPGGANEIRVYGVVISSTVTITRMMVKVVTSDGANNYDWGIYDSAGTLKCRVGAHTPSATGMSDRTCVGGSVSLTGGAYLIAMTGAAATARIDGSGGAGPFTFLNWVENAAVTETSSGGVLPSTITPPATSWGFGGNPWFALR